MKLILGFGYMPYTQKPVDYQPYRPVYLFRGPPPDAGFSYGLFEDEETGKQYYADLGLESFSPLSSTEPRLLEELDEKQLQQLLGNDLSKENLRECECPNCSAHFYDNFHAGVKGRDDFNCHRCGSKLPLQEAKKGEPMPSHSTAASSPVDEDPSVKEFIEKNLETFNKSVQMKELVERMSNRHNIPAERAKHDILLALKKAIQG